MRRDAGIPPERRPTLSMSIRHSLCTPQAGQLREVEREITGRIGRGGTAFLEASAENALFGQDEAF